MNPFENTLFWVNSDIENTKYAIQISIERGKPHYELDDYLEDLFEIQKYLSARCVGNKNKYMEMSEREAVEDCEREIFDVVTTLIDAYGRFAGKESLEKATNELVSNGYFTE